MRKKYALSSFVATFILLLCFTTPAFACSDCEPNNYTEEYSYSYDEEHYFSEYQLMIIYAAIRLQRDIKNIINNYGLSFYEAVELLELRSSIQPRSPCRTGGGVPCNFGDWIFAGIGTNHDMNCPHSNFGCLTFRGYVRFCNWGCGRDDVRVTSVTPLNCRPL